MNKSSYLQYAIIADDSAEILTDKLNAVLYRLRDKRPTTTFDGMVAHVAYYETETKPETLGDEYEAQGVRLTCELCPLFSPITKADGSIDRRIKYGDCPICEFGRAYKDARVCDSLLQMINNGEVKLCLSADTITE